MNKLKASLVILTCIPLASLGQAIDWNEPFPPHKVMDNLYYVGTAQLSSFLIATDAGLILVNSSYESSVPVIKAAVEELGFNFGDIKILISGHAHPDHIEGDALVKEMTGAQVAVGREEIPAVRAFKHPAGKTLPIDLIIDDGESLTLGDTTLTAHLLPGHTKGCLAWTLDLEENGRSYKGFIECSINGQYLQYVNNEEYPDIAEDMRATYQKARAIAAEVWVSSHPMFYGLEAKYEQLGQGGNDQSNPFYDPEGYQRHVDEFEDTFKAALSSQLEQAQQ